MSLIQDIFGGLLKREEQPSAAQPAENQKKADGGSYLERIIPCRDPNMALTVSAVYRAIELRSKTIGQMPVQYRIKDKVGGNFTPWMEGIGRRINYLLQEEPNPLMTAASLWEQVTINRLQMGNGFVYIERDTFGDPLYLWLAMCAGYDLVTGTYNLVYLTDQGIREAVNVPKDDVLHFPNTYRRQNGFWGIPTLQYVADTLSLIKTEKRQALETAAKGGRVKGFIGEERPANTAGTLASGMYGKKAGDAYAQELQDKLWSGQDIVSIRGLEKFQNISMTSAEMELISQINLGYDDVARFYAVPRPLLMLDTNSHYNDYQNATMEFLSRTIAPDAADMQKEIFRKLIGPRYYGMRDIHICEKPLLAMDLERQAKVDQLNLQTGAKTVNEIRAEHDMPSVKNGDTPYVSTNLAELGSEKLSKNGGGRPSDIKPIDEDPEQKTKGGGKTETETE